MQLDVPHLLEPDAGRAASDRAERTVRVLCSHELLAVTWSRYEPGERGPDPHVHRRHTDEFYVLEGEVVFTAGDDEVVLGPGGFISSPPGARHGFRSAGGRARVLNLHTPGGGFTDGIRRTTHT